VDPENWPPNSPDLNPVEFDLSNVYRRHIRNVEQLKEILQTPWEEIGQDPNDRTIGQFHK